MDCKPVDARILSQHGNVIAADFRPRPTSSGSVEIEIKSEILYCDELACLVRYRLLLGGKLISTQHVTMLTPTD